MDVTDRDDGNAGDGDDEFAVFLDPLDVALGTLVDTVNHAHAIARVVLRRIRAEILHVATGIGRGHEDEGAHLCIVNHPGFAGPGLRIEHEIPVVLVFEVDQPLRRATHEHQRRNQLFLDIRQATALIPFFSMVRYIRLDTFGIKQGFEVDDPVVEYFQGVPVVSFGGGIDDGGCHDAGCISHSPAFRGVERQAEFGLTGLSRTTTVLLSKSRRCNP